jgi:non-canonical poly(A) RNA polymerase PAPD5/7
MLSLRDPADETNDLGRKGIAIKHVQATMADMCGKLDGALRHNTLQTMLTPLVDPVYMLNKQGRYKLRNYGKRLSTGLQLSLASKAKAIREAEAASTATSEAEDMWEGLPGMESDAKVV